MVWIIWLISGGQGISHNFCSRRPNNFILKKHDQSCFDISIVFIHYMLNLSTVNRFILLLRGWRKI